MSETQAPTPSVLSSPMPLQLSGFLAGDTIQVQGETVNLQFSLRLDINQKTFPDNSLDTIAYSPKNLGFSSSSYATPIASREPEDDQSNENVGESGARTRTRTRLRSGVIPPVAYFPRIPLWKLEPRSRKKKKKKMGVLERLLRRRSCPVRPCTSYAFFVMENWGVVNKSSSFTETSKRVAKMWHKLPTNDKKLYEEMALKDSARYKWQAELFLSNEQRRLEE